MICVLCVCRFEKSLLPNITIDTSNCIVAIHSMTKTVHMNYMVSLLMLKANCSTHAVCVSMRLGFWWCWACDPNVPVVLIASEMATQTMHCLYFKAIQYDYFVVGFYRFQFDFSFYGATFCWEKCVHCTFLIAPYDLPTKTEVGTLPWENWKYAWLHWMADKRRRRCCNCLRRFLYVVRLRVHTFDSHPYVIHLLSVHIQFDGKKTIVKIWDDDFCINCTICRVKREKNERKRNKNHMTCYICVHLDQHPFVSYSIVKWIKKIRDSFPVSTESDR